VQSRKQYKSGDSLLNAKVKLKTRGRWTKDAKGVEIKGWDKECLKPKQGMKGWNKEKTLPICSDKTAAREAKQNSLEILLSLFSRPRPSLSKFLVQPSKQLGMLSSISFENRSRTGGLPKNVNEQMNGKSPVDSGRDLEQQCNGHTWF